MLRKYTLVGALALLLALGVVGRASAHAKLVSSTPAAGAKVTKAPATVTLVFSEEIGENGSSFTVTDSKGATVGSGKLDLNDLDHKTLTGTLQSGLGDGVYTVAWQAITTDDNGKTQGTFTFGVNADPNAQTAATTSAATTVATTAASQPAATAATGGATATSAAGQNATTLPATGGEASMLPLLLLLAAVAILVGVVLRGQFARKR